MVGILKKKIIILDSVGFESISDFFGNILATKGIMATSGIIVGFLTYMDSFIELNIYSPARGIYILFAATIFDIMLGISVAVRDKAFDAYKLNKAWVRLVVQITIIGLLHQSNIVWELVNDWMVNTLLLAFVLTTIWSSFKNAHKLGWIQPSTFIVLQRILSIDDIFKKIFDSIIKKESKKSKKDDKKLD